MPRSCCRAAPDFLGQGVLDTVNRIEAVAALEGFQPARSVASCHRCLAMCPEDEPLPRDLNVTKGSARVVRRRP